MKEVFIFIFWIVLFSGCVSGGDNTVVKEELTGRWELIEGTRNGEVTASLEGTYFEFDDHQMSTNLPIPGAEGSAFELTDNKIEQQVNDDLTLVYELKSKTDTSILLSTRLQGFDFTFLLKKVEKKEGNF